MANYFRTFYISNFKAPTGALYPPETVEDLRWMTAPLQPIRLPVQLVKQSLTFNRIEVTFDFNNAPIFIRYEVPQRLPPRAPEAPSGGPILEPSLLRALTVQPFTPPRDPLRLPPRRPDPCYGIQTWLAAWYSAPNPVETSTAPLQPIHLPPRAPRIEYRTPIQPDQIREPSLWQAPIVVTIPPRIIPQAAFNVPVPPITIDAVVTRRQTDPAPGRLPPRGPSQQPSFVTFAETYIVTVDKWRTAPELPIRARAPAAQGGNFAPPIVPTFGIFSWWAQLPTPARLPPRLVPTTFFNCGLPLPGDASTVSQVDWSKPIVIRPPTRVPHTQSTQPSFQSYDLTIAGFGASLQPVRSKLIAPAGGSTLTPAFVGLEGPQCFAASSLPLRPSLRTPAPPMPFAKIVVALDFPQAMPQPIVLPRRALILPTSFSPPAVSDSSQPRFSPAAQPIVSRSRTPAHEPAPNLEPSLFTAPTPISWQQPTVPVRMRVRAPWTSPSAFIFRPVAARTGFAEASEVFTPYAAASEAFTPHAAEEQVFTPHAGSAAASQLS